MTRFSSHTAVGVFKTPAVIVFLLVLILLPLSASGESGYVTSSTYAVILATDTGCDSIDPAHSDVNLNEIPYEVADYVLFKHYFIYGSSVFTRNLEKQIYETDLNDDGRCLTLEDMVYFGLILNGSTSPFPRHQPPDTAEFSFDNNGKLSVESNLRMPIQAVHLVLAGKAFPLLLADQMDMKFYYDDSTNTTRVLIYSDRFLTHSDNINANIESGEIVKIAGDNKILSIEAATKDARKVALDIVKTKKPLATIRLEEKSDAWQGRVDSVAITMDASDIEIDGFDFIIQFDPTAFRLVDVTPGKYVKECDWEYFNYRAADNDTWGDSVCASGIIRIKAIADLPNGSNYPSCYIVDTQNSKELAKIHLLISNDRTLEAAQLPINFIWYDCLDNVLSRKYHHSKLLSNRVFYYELLYNSNHCEIKQSVDITDHNHFKGYPTKHGHQLSDCDELNSNSLVDFYNGYFNFNYNRYIDASGDINLDEIPYDAKDYDLFVDYFLEGPKVFRINIDGQVAATDINRDGNTLTVQDMVFLSLVMDGYISPCRPDSLFPPDTVKFTYDGSDAIAIAWKAHLRSPIKALYLTVEGKASPQLLTDQMDMNFNYDDSTNVTKILIHSGDINSYISREAFLKLPDNPHILSIEAASLDARKVVVNLNGRSFD